MIIELKGKKAAAEEEVEDDEEESGDEGDEADEDADAVFTDTDGMKVSSMIWRTSRIAPIEGM